MARTVEPRFGFKNVFKAKKTGKIKGYFTLLIPTESQGYMELEGMRVIEGQTGPFVSWPNRAYKTSQQATVTANGATVTGIQEVTKYRNIVRWDSQARYNEVTKIVNEEVLPLVLAGLSK